MFCPECGLDAQDARFCPECGTDLTAVRGVLGEKEPDAAPPPRRAPRPSGRTTGGYASSRPGGTPPRSPRPAQQRRAGAPAQGPSAQAAPSRLSPLLIWAVAGVIMVVIVAAIMIVGRSPSGATAAGGVAGQPSGPVAADTSGAYRELVARANGLYDQGAQAFQSKNPSGAAQYFAAAATVYEAAWAKQPGDPNVGTDLATSLYYSGDTAAALKQVDAVLAKTPDFQSGRLNKGIYLQAASQDAQQNGQSAKATKLLAQARAELEKAVAIDPAAAAGKKAAEILKTL